LENHARLLEQLGLPEETAGATTSIDMPLFVPIPRCKHRWPLCSLTFPWLNYTYSEPPSFSPALA